jgi:uncharacterized membrane protein
MTGTVAAVAWAALAFVGSHLALSSRPVRGPLIGRIGERGFRGLYSIVAAATLVWLILAYNRAPHVPWWTEPSWGRPLAMALMLLASVLFVAGLSPANPTVAGNERRFAAAEPGRGVFAITRHPMLWSFALWGVAHLVVKGDGASVVFFGAFAVLALAGQTQIDTRRRAAGDEAWAKVEAATSAVPFAALIAGRARFAMADFGWWRLGLGLALFAVLLHAHRPVIGLSPFP